MYTMLNNILQRVIRPKASLPQILHDALRQGLGRPGVLAGVQLAVNHHAGIKRIGCALEFSTEFIDLVLQPETEILGKCRL